MAEHGRLIDADALIEELNASHFPGAPYVDAGISIAIGKICDALTIEPESQWIPVSERLPEYGVAVLTYDGHCFCVEKRIPTIRDDEGEPITGDWWVSDDYDEYDGDYYPNLRDGACIAWMPLPEPWKEGEANGN